MGLSSAFAVYQIRRRMKLGSDVTVGQRRRAWVLIVVVLAIINLLVIWMTGYLVLWTRGHWS